MFVLGKSADLKFRGNTMGGGWARTDQCPVLKELIIYLRGQGGDAQQKGRAVHAQQQLSGTGSTKRRG